MKKQEILAMSSKKEKPVKMVYKHSVNTDIFPEYNNLAQESHTGMGIVTIELNRKTDKLYINKCEVTLGLVEGQTGGKIGYQVRDALTGKPVLNACVLEFLLKNPHMIPESWKQDEDGNTIYIFFWGTIYRNSRGRLYIRCLCWRGDAWSHDFYWFAYDWRSYDPTALLAS